MTNLVSTSAKSFNNEVMPTAKASYADRITQYLGATGASYTNGYFYKCSQGNQVASVLTKTGTSALGTITVNKSTFETKTTAKGVYTFYCTELPSSITTIHNGLVEVFTRASSFDRASDYAWVNGEDELVYTEDEQPSANDEISDGFRTVGKVTAVTDDSLQWRRLDTREIVTLSSYGISYSGTASSGCTIVVDYTPAYTAYKWDRIDVQTPAGDVEITVEGVTDSIKDHITTLKNDLGDLGDTVDERAPSAPDTDGTYILKCTVASGVKTYSWVVEA